MHIIFVICPYSLSFLCFHELPPFFCPRIHPKAVEYMGPEASERNNLSQVQQAYSKVCCAGTPCCNILLVFMSDIDTCGLILYLKYIQHGIGFHTIAQKYKEELRRNAFYTKKSCSVLAPPFIYLHDFMHCFAAI